MNTLCPQCGAPVNAGATKCDYCGAVIAQQAPAAPAAGVAQPVIQVVAAPVHARANWPVKSKIVAAVLAFFLGGLGIHKFYLNQSGWGVLYLLFCWTGIPAFWSLIDGLILLLSSDENFMIKYRCRIG